MLRAAITAIVTRCTRHAWAVLLISAVLGAVSSVYAVKHFAINTDVNALIAKDIPWRKREITFENSFPQRLQSILAVVDAPTPELASQAADALVAKLSGNKELFLRVAQPGGGEFFRRNGLLFLDVGETVKVATQLTQAEPLIAALATDPSIRGLVEVLQLGLTGVEMEKIKLEAMRRPMTITADTVEAVLNKKPVNFSWHELMNPDTTDCLLYTSPSPRD